MNSLLEFLPIIAFFAVYKWVGGIEAVYPATATAIGAATLVAAVAWRRQGSLPRRQLVMLAAFLVMGGLTLAFHDARFIKAKPTIVEWLSAVLFLGSQFIGSKTLIQRAFGGSVTLEPHIWRRLNLAWVVFFTLLGGLNLYVARIYSTDIWVNFKLFGVLGLTLVFVVLQGFYLMRYDKSVDSTVNDA
ncbi:MAG: septation protein A [Gammaproteobacteria bacterium]|nr:septation protein A [Gammaproteobacteria bacterium]